MNDILKLLDNGWRVTIYKNALSTYSAMARKKTAKRNMEIITDHFSPEEALNALVNKVLGLGWQP